MRLWKPVILICCVLFACSKPIDMPLPPHEPRLVLHGYVATGEYFSVAIGKSRLANDYMSEADSYVENAWVALYENDHFLDSLRYDAIKRRYVSQIIKAQPGKTYTIRAGADGFKTIDATATATNPVNTTELIHVPKARTTFFGEELDDVTFSFQDPGNEKNFYIVTLSPSLWSYNTVNCLYSSDPAIERIQADVVPTEDLNQCIENGELFFSDKSFSGTVKRMTISTSSRSLEPKPDSLGRIHRPYMKRYSISEDYYRYLKGIISLDGAGETPIQREPVVLKGNVNNGYGIFAVSSVAIDSLR